MPQIVPSQIVQVIEKYFPMTKDKRGVSFEVDRGKRNECISLAKMLEQVSQELLNPATTDDYAILVSNISILNYFLDLWKNMPKTSSDSLTGKDGANPISVIHDILLKCPDQAISPQAAGLDFVDDQDLRENLRLDLTSMANSLSNGEWKAATVLAGSITEALLLWALEKEAPSKQSEMTKSIAKHHIKTTDLNDWILDWYNKVAHDLSLIKETTYIQVDQARGFRNNIHPGREVRKKTKCSKGTAYSGVSAVELVIEDLSERYRGP